MYTDVWCHYNCARWSVLGTGTYHIWEFHLQAFQNSAEECWGKNTAIFCRRVPALPRRTTSFFQLHIHLRLRSWWWRNFRHTSSSQGREIQQYLNTGWTERDSRNLHLETCSCWRLFWRLKNNMGVLDFEKNKRGWGFWVSILGFTGHFRTRPRAKISMSL